MGGAMSKSTGELRMLIGGELVEGVSRKPFEKMNPAPEDVLDDVADASTEDMYLFEHTVEPRVL
jgi:aldehyde dehydrogenase (NAD+)